MTAFASRTGSDDLISWTWEMRSVNARGLDVKMRLPDGIEGLEAAVRAAVTARFSRGSIFVNLRLNREDSVQAMQLDEAQLDRVLSALDEVQERAFAMGVTLGQATAADVLAQRGVIVQGQPAKDTHGLRPRLLADLETLLGEFTAMRATEGAALEGVIRGQLDQIGALTEASKSAAADRRDAAKASLTAALRRVIDDVSEVEESRVAQELALLAVKSDVTEEIDRLLAHVAAARDLLDDEKAAGRRLDFLAQEFNREANTLCSKAGSTPLTAIGLDLKAVIDQMREQIQNVE